MSKLVERAGGGRVVLPEGKGAEIDVRLMGWEPGSDIVEGSSADYPVAAIQRDFEKAFPVGTRMRANHDGMCEAGGDIRRIMAKTTSKPQKREDGMYAKARVREGDATDFMRQFADVIGTSVSVGVELVKVPAEDEDGEPILNSEGQPVMVNKLGERGLPIVERFLTMDESPYNAVDFVEAPGADGRIVAVAVEAARELVEKHTTIREAATFAIDLAGEREKDSEATPPGNTKKENEMEKEERDSLRDEIVQSVTEALKPARPTTEHKLSDTVEAVLEAGLSKRGRAAVIERIEAGGDAASVIAEQKAFEDDIRAEVGGKPAAQAEAETVTGYTVGEGSGFPERERATVSEADQKVLAALEANGEVL